MRENSNIISEFLKQNKMNVHSFAKMVHVTPSTIYNILKNNVIRIDTARKIHEGTDGKLDISNFDCTWPGGKNHKKNVV